MVTVKLAMIVCGIEVCLYCFKSFESSVSLTNANGPVYVYYQNLKDTLLLPY